MKNRKVRKHVLCLIVSMFIVASSFGYVHAFSIDVGEDATLDIDVALGYSLQVRTKANDPGGLINNGNTDDALRMFDKWTPNQNGFNAVVDVEYAKENWAIFVRGKGYYDHAFMRDHQHDNPATYGAFVAGLVTDPNKWSEDVQDVHGMGAKWMDYFLSYNFELGSTMWDFRIGNQVLQWGDTIFYAGTMSVMAPGDGTALPSATAKETLLPSGSVYLNVDLTEAISVSGFYKYEWVKSLVPEAGYFMGALDFNGDGGTVILVPGVAAIRHGKDEEPKDWGQYGFRMLYRMEAMGAAEIGLHHINYHPTTPYNTLQFAPGPTHYNQVYNEDQKLTSISFTGELFEQTWIGEIDYHQNIPMGQNNSEEEYIFYHFGLNSYRQPPMILNKFFTSYYWQGEVGIVQRLGDKEDYDPNTDMWVYGGTIYFSLSKDNWPFAGIDYSNYLMYRTASGGGGPLTDLGDFVATGLSFDLYTQVDLGIDYLTFLHSDFAFHDRDLLSMTLTYSF